MKKLFNYALLAAALLVGVNVNAVNEVSLSINGGAATEYAKFTDALKAICKTAQYNTEEQKTEATITLLVDVTGVQYEDWMKDFVQDAGKTDRIKLNRGEYITIDLNGKTLTSNLRFNAYHGGVLLTGKKGSKVLTNISQFITLYGNQDEMFAESGYSYALIDENVSLIANTENVYYCAGMYTPSIGAKYSGIKCDIKGQLISTANREGCAFASSGNMQYKRDETTIPVINIYPTAVLQGSDALFTFTEAKLKENNNKILNDIIAKGYTEDEARQYKNTGAGLYCPGVAEFNIEGTVKGGVGIYIKGGKVNITNAHIFATAAEYWKPIVYGNGFYGAGSAIILDSHEDYGTLEGVTIQGSTISSDNGYAIEEDATKGESSLPVIEVISGTFVGGITTTPEEKAELVNRNNIQGGEWHGQDVSQYVNPANYTILEFVDGEGKQYQVVVPIKESDWAQSIAAAKDSAEGKKYAYVKADEPVATNTTVEFVRIADGKTVTVKEGATLDAGTLMTEGNSQIIVEAGATLIVSGEQGAYTFDEKSLIIKTNTENYGQLLINPAVVLNTTPKATVRFNSDAFRDEKTGNHAQLFGNPMVSVDKINAYNVKGNASATAAIYFDVWKNSQWNYIGGFNVGQDLDKTKLEPFGLYCITSKNIKDSLLYYVMEGNLVGNSQPQDFNLNYGWTSAANSWTGNMGGQALVDALNALVDGGAQGVSVNAYMPTIEGNTITWNAYGMAELIDGEFHVEPMQPMMFDNEEAKIIPTDIMSYENLVWNSRPSAPKTQAPRYATNDIKKANIRVTSTEGISDRVVVAETEQYSDPRYSARKYMNDEICVYVNADKNYDVYMVENVENTYVGFNCKNAGKYTVSFEKVSGNFALIDLKTNARIEMNEGTTYEFLAEAGEDAYRFVIVAGAQAPTEMQKTKTAVKANKALVNGQIVISNGERFFNVLGNEVK